MIIDIRHMCALPLLGVTPHLSVFELIEQTFNREDLLYQNAFEPPPPVALAVVRSKAVVLLLFATPIVVFCNCGILQLLCFVVRYFVSILVLQSSQWERESWLLCFVYLPGVS